MTKNSLLKNEVSLKFKKALAEMHQCYQNYTNYDWDIFLLKAPLVWRQVLIALHTRKLGVWDLQHFVFMDKNSLQIRLRGMVDLGVLNIERTIVNGRKKNLYYHRYIELAKYCVNADITEYIVTSDMEVRRIIYDKLKPFMTMFVNQLENNGIVTSRFQENIEPYVGAFMEMVDNEYYTNVETRKHYKKRKDVSEVIRSKRYNE